jgi:hypothetical protein
VLTPKKLTQPADGRGGAERTGEPSVSEDGKTNYLGFFLITGRWTHNATGTKILGFYTESSTNSVNCTTNEVTTYHETNNIDGSISFWWETNLVKTCEAEGITNSLSFTATVRPNVRLSVKAVSVNGNRTLKGVPEAALTDISGDYYVEGKRAGVRFTEFLSLAPVTGATYIGAGEGAGYEIPVGIALASSQKRLSWVYKKGPNVEDPLVTVYGSINYSTRKASLKGFDEENARIYYKLIPQPSLD